MSEAENLSASVQTCILKRNFEDQPDGYEYVPVVIEKSPECMLSNLKDNKFLVSPKIKIVQLQFKIKAMLNLPVEKCFFFYTNNYWVWEPSTTFKELYEHFNRKNIYIKYTDENLYVTDICDKLKEMQLNHSGCS